jgi:CubicO group peptidase (beta-lactamase class C family)
MTHPHLFLAGCTLVLCSVAISQTGAADTTTQQTDEIFRPLVGVSSPGLSVIVLKHGKTVFEGSYGLANLKTQTPITPVTDFRLASFTKQFTAMCIMLLVHDGKLSYDDTLTKVFPDFPAYGGTITVRMLLTHTSGLKDYEDLYSAQYPGQDDRKIPQITDAQILALMKQQTATDFRPGSQWRYSNTGYAILAMIVEKTAGKPFRMFLHDRIFAPLGMNHTLAYEKGKNEVPNRSLGYTNKDGRWIEADQSSTSAVLGDGGVYSNVEDLAKWDRALRDHALLSASEMRVAFTPVKVPGAAKKDDGTPTEYGFGWFLDPYNGRKRAWHSGTTTGFRTFIDRFIDEGLTIIILCNRDDLHPGKLADRVADLYATH